MKPNQQANKNLGSGSNMQSGVVGTDPQKVKQEIRKDVSAGQGAVTSREAGGMRD